MKKSKLPESKPPPSQPVEVPPRRRLWFILFGIIGLASILTVTTLVLFYYNIQSLWLHAFIELNVILILFITILIFRNVIKLYFERNRRFRAKLVISFLFLSLFPTVMLFFFATQIINESISRWFNPKVEVFLEGAYEVASYLIDEKKELALHYAEVLAHELVQRNLMDMEEQLLAFLDTKRNEYHIGAIQIYTSDGVELIRSTEEQEVPKDLLKKTRLLLEKVLDGETVYDIISSQEATLIKAAAPIVQNQQKETPSQIIGALQVNLLIKQNLFEKIRSISRANQEYHKLQVARTPFRAIYLLIFIFITLALLFSAIWFGHYLAKDIAIPVIKLADATREVTGGNLDVKVDVRAYDEIGTLVDSFNMMTQQLKSNKMEIEAANRELIEKNTQIEQKKAFIETLLNNIQTGVIAVDKQGYITSVNEAAGNIFKFSPIDWFYRHYQKVWQDYPFDRLKYWLEQLYETNAKALTRQMNIKLGDEVVYLDVNIEALHLEGKYEGQVIVVEDLTDLLKAQRAAAWQEVARRIAHEVKNPLTPISLSAQRMRRKYYENKKDFKEVFESCSHTIIEEVEHLKKMVNEFSKFARLPKAEPQPNDIHELIHNTLTLYEGSYPNLHIETDLCKTMPEINVDADQMKRVLVNLIDNAIAAMDQKGVVRIITEFDPLFQIARFIVADEGPGIHEEDRDKLFLPYFSTKGDKGTGLGLAIVNKIIADHNGYIRVRDNKPRGTKFIIELPTGYSMMALRR